MAYGSLNLLEELGWEPFFQEHFQELSLPGSIPARVVSESRSSYRVCSQRGELTASVPGRMRYGMSAGQGLPAVGDWVMVKSQPDEQKGVIQAILPRKSKFSRKVTGKKTEEQVVAANVDTVFIVNGLDGGRNFNLRRIERYLTLAWQSGASPVIVLNKVDLCPDVESYTESVETVALGVPVHAVSAVERLGLDDLRKYLARGKTVALLGSSGVGKSALINALLGVARQSTGRVRRGDLRGRHTTTRRELILVPGGGAVIDTPGMREIQLWAVGDGLDGAFQDIEQLSEGCRFHDCRHVSEPDCAVLEAVSRGELASERLESYRKLKGELDYLSLREQYGAKQAEKVRWQKVAQWVKEMRKHGE
jgi:ribosome biogenesis GTPase